MKKTIAQMKKDSLLHGKYYFDKETMEFWNSHIESELFDNNTFVTSEDNFDRTKILYTVRQYDWDSHDVKTIGKFQAYENLEDAITFAQAYRGGK